jgi:phospholipase C
MDGFMAAFENQPKVGDTPMGYYDDTDIPYYWNVADQHVLFDRNFTSAAGGSVWNHFYWVTGTPGNPAGDSLLPGGFDHVPTIFDKLQESGISWKFYVQNYDPRVTFRDPNVGNGEKAAQIIWVPLLNYNRFLDDPELSKHIVPLEEYFSDLTNGTLPAVSYIAPSGTSEHPPGSIQSGMRSTRNMINALTMSSAWSSSAFMWTYDDWGGWYDHVPPPIVDQYGYGFRAPALLVSAYARVGKINSTVIDFTSQLKFIEENWGLSPLAERDGKANNISSAFDFQSPARDPVLITERRDVASTEPAQTAVVYTLYGGALILPPLLVIGGIRFVRKRRQPSLVPLDET